MKLTPSISRHQTQPRGSPSKFFLLEDGRLVSVRLDVSGIIPTLRKLLGLEAKYILKVIDIILRKAKPGVF